MPPAQLSLTERQAFTSIRTFLTSALPNSIEVIRGQNNRVGEPQGDDYVVFWPLLHTRLSTNTTTYTDNYVLGSINLNVLTVTQVLSGGVPLGQLIFDKLNSLPNAVINSQLSGSPNGIGNYQLSISRTLSQEVLYCGVRQDLVPIQLTVQLDVHGPNSADNAVIIEGLFRSSYGTDNFDSSGFDIEPLYCDEFRYVPFINAEQQYEFRWIGELNLQINPVISTLQQFASQLQEGKIIADNANLASTKGPIVIGPNL